MQRYPYRRNHRFSAAAIFLSAVLAALAPLQDIVTVSGPNLGVNLGERLGLDLQPSGTYAQDDVVSGILWGAAAAWAVAALLLLITTVRFLGLIWRIGALLVAILPGAYAFQYWRFVTDPVGVVTEQDSGAVEGLGNILRSVGLWDVSPGPGLYLLTASLVTFVIGVVTPSRRQERREHSMGYR